MEKYVVCGYKPWNRQSFDSIISAYPGEWHFVDSKDELTWEFLQEKSPRYIFFLHWSWIIPSQIIDTFECINFHLTDLPYGRGGSPLQNLIMNGVREHTKLTAHRMVEEIDAGPLYLQRDLSLEGSAQEILIRQSDLAAHMIKDIIETEPVPVPQKGDIVVFDRRTPDMSEVPELDSAEKLYDFIRMLDAEGYPRAFIQQGNFRYEFSNAQLEEDTVSATVSISSSQTS
jgi:methionyl-tRNA formyltransferase